MFRTATAATAPRQPLTLVEMASVAFLACRAPATNAGRTCHRVESSGLIVLSLSSDNGSLQAGSWDSLQARCGLFPTAMAASLPCLAPCHAFWVWLSFWQLERCRPRLFEPNCEVLTVLSRCAFHSRKSGCGNGEAARKPQQGFRSEVSLAPGDLIKAGPMLRHLRLQPAAPHAS